MKSINRVTFLGYIVADPEVKTTKNKKRVSSFVIATNNEWFDSEGELKKSVDFHRVVAWDHLAELSGKHLRKGSPIFLEGRLTNRSYEGKDKITHYITEVVANTITILQWQKERVHTEELSNQEEKELALA
ncbi:single-stranded DNA-binding protein [Candidatus Peregrinibacteria bacterium]|nr:MAG: single-stranded DNA-binding protein [Candidatus Peregrinibacteria bacterium]